MPVLGWLQEQRRRRVRRRLLKDEDNREDIVDEVHHHWVVYLLPFLEMVAAVAVLALMFSVGGADSGWLFMLVALLLLVHGGYRALVEFMDVFVITNMRVFRLSGVTHRKHATTPLARILDITVEQPSFGLLLGYGHFTFESAAQEQGLRDIRFVAKPLERDLTIQRHVQRSGLRGGGPRR